MRLWTLNPLLWVKSVLGVTVQEDRIFGDSSCCASEARAKGIDAVRRVRGSRKRRRSSINRNGVLAIAEDETGNTRSGDATLLAAFLWCFSVFSVLVPLSLCTCAGGGDEGEAGQSSTVARAPSMSRHQPTVP